MKAIAIAVVMAAVAVSGCGLSPAYRAKVAEQRTAADDATCKSYGAKPGTDIYTQCRMTLAQNRAATGAAQSAYLQSAGAAILAANRAQPTYRTTNCRRIGSTVHCTSY